MVGSAKSLGIDDMNGVTYKRNESNAYAYPWQPHFWAAVLAIKIVGDLSGLETDMLKGLLYTWQHAKGSWPAGATS